MEIDFLKEFFLLLTTMSYHLDENIANVPSAEDFISNVNTALKLAKELHHLTKAFVDKHVDEEYKKLVQISLTIGLVVSLIIIIIIHFILWKNCPRYKAFFSKSALPGHRVVREDMLLRVLRRSRSPSPKQLNASCLISSETNPTNEFSRASAHQQSTIEERETFEQQHTAELNTASQFKEKFEVDITDETSNTNAQQHSKNKNFDCPECPYKAKSESSIREHLRHHYASLAHKCTLCSFSSKSQAGLAFHAKLHKS